jgi:hypothetical protein
MLLLEISNPNNIQAAEYGVNGTISCTVFLPNGKVFTNQYLPDHPFPFTAIVRSNSWNIKVTFGEEYYLWVGCDGKNVYSILEDPKARKTPQSSMPARISPGLYPLCEDWYITIPWLALCSSTYFDEFGTTNLPAPWLNARHEPTALIFGADVKRAEVESGLPTSIIFEVNKKLKDNLEKSNWLDSQYLQATAMDKLNSFDDGFKGSEYTVKTSTNFDGIVLPLEFELKRYLPTQNSKDAHLTSIFEGEVTQIFQPTNVSFLPEIKGRASAADFRYRDTSAEVDYVNYTLSNKVWTVSNPSSLQAFYEEKRSRAVQMGVLRPTEAAHTKRMRLIIIMLFALITLLPIFWLYRRRQH